MTADLLAALGSALEKGHREDGEDVLHCMARDEALLAAGLENAWPLECIDECVVTPGAPACAGPLFELPRRAARAGNIVERLYLLPEPALAADGALDDHLALDRGAGIRTTILNIGPSIAASELPIALLLDCTLWRGADGSSLLVNGSAAPGWMLSARSDDIATRRALIENLRRNSMPVVAGAFAPAELYEPLLTSAPLAKLAASALCRRGGDEDCSWYHGFWQYLRIIGIVAAPERHAGFYAEALGGLAKSGDYPRILISANADYAMLAHLLHAYAGHIENIEIMVLDICETPLMLCKWYGARQGVRIETQASDIVQWETTRQFDLIVTHSFLPMLPAAARQSLVAKWLGVLRPGGEVVSTTRINPEWTEADIHPDLDRVQGFRENAQRQALKWQGVLGIDAEQLAAAAENYMRRMKSFSLTSEDELRTLFTASGFTFDMLNIVTVAGRVGRPQAGPGTSQSAEYAEFIATRA
ncbi:MAG: class I SAM-dependent methyltransferase [Proteobacteria bacterium]|nr:class I SAM-dependent methyltransferase [Pseudomonadota bacterium]MDA1357007.1 class I SAM-dependent methyltransferase [Pseudomonadota bacterium]